MTRSEKSTAIPGSYLVVIAAIKYAQSLEPSNPTFGYINKINDHISHLTCVQMLILAVCGGRQLEAFHVSITVRGLGTHESMGVSQRKCYRNGKEAKAIHSTISFM